jgi:hypothetical protein
VFETGKEIQYPGLDKFKVSEESSNWIAILLETATSSKPESDSTAKDQTKKNKKDKKKEGKTLFLTDPITGDSVSFKNVSEFALSKNGDMAAFIQVRKDSVDSVFVSLYNTVKMESQVVFEGEGVSENVALDVKGEQLAFTFSSDTTKNKAFDLIYYNIKNKVSEPVLTKEFKENHSDLVVSKFGKIQFNEKGDELYFGTVKRPEHETKDTLTEDEKVSLDIWNWKDPLLQPHQLKQLKKEQERSYEAVYFPDENKTVQLASEEIEDVRIDVKATGKYSIGSTNKPYRKMLSWDASRYYNIYLFNRQTGSHKLILEQVASTVSLSPGQNFVAWYNIADSSWNALDLDSGQTRNLTSAVKSNFYNELNDVPNEAGSYGFAGWTKKEKLLVYDRFDIWLFDPAGKEAPKNITNDYGRKNNLKFRYVKLDKEEQFLPEMMMLSAFNEVNKQAGFFRLNLKNGELNKLVLGDFYYKNVVKAKEAEKIIWRRESFTDFPDVYLSELDFQNSQQLSNANPQQSDYNWGTTELVDWVSFREFWSSQKILIQRKNTQCWSIFMSAVQTG